MPRRYYAFRHTWLVGRCCRAQDRTLREERKERREREWEGGMESRSWRLTISWAKCKYIADVLLFWRSSVDSFRKSGINDLEPSRRLREPRSLYARYYETSIEKNHRKWMFCYYEGIKTASKVARCWAKTLHNLNYQPHLTRNSAAFRSSNQSEKNAFERWKNSLESRIESTCMEFDFIGRWKKNVMTKLFWSIASLNEENFSLKFSTTGLNFWVNKNSRGRLHAKPIWRACPRWLSEVAWAQASRADLVFRIHRIAWEPRRRARHLRFSVDYPLVKWKNPDLANITLAAM